jgi:hypothetical protein
MSALGITVAGLSAATPGASAGEAHAAAPLEGLHAHLCAFHLAKKNPKFVVEAHHYCAAVNDSLHQCVIFDSAGKGARILGVEYIITDKVYRTLPEAEKKFWHVHTYEILSGLLIAPGMAKEAEQEFMAAVLTTWGKCWHTWPDPEEKLPLGEPLLMWSSTRDGQISKELLAKRDEQFKVSTSEIRKRRAYLGPVPRVAPPKSLEDVGRQWTNDGPDEPRKD